MQTTTGPQKVVVITGADSGIGLEAAKVLAKQGYEIALVCRTKERGNNALAILKSITGPNTQHRLFLADLADREQIFSVTDALKETYDHIDLLINNAGLMSYKKQLAPDGLELQLAVHVRAPFMLINLLLDRVNAAPAGRIVNVSSDLHKSGFLQWDDMSFAQTPYSMMRAYGNSKMALTTMTNELSRRLAGLPLTIGSLHPGVIKTNLFRNFKDMNFLAKATLSLANVFLMTPEQGAKSILMLATDPKLEGQKSIYLHKTTVGKAIPATYEAEAGKRLWKWLEIESTLITMI
jgi:NAD(P)-dependent dehydrogenase (short-subunit alcohol dehydrogenase family)